MADVTNPHDTLFNYTLSDLTSAREFFKATYRLRLWLTLTLGHCRLVTVVLPVKPSRPVRG